MPCAISQEQIDATIAFHGHSCPGLAIGIRASELAMRDLAIHETANTLCLTETDMCGVDAIQFLTGCSFGKGNLVHRDYGKAAFTFFNRDTGKGFRALLKDVPGGKDMDREARLTALMEADLDELFDVKEVETPPVRPAKILTSITCDACGESVMESRIRLFGGKSYCIPCFMEVEQKI